jgi:hypothetical protein
MPQHSSLLLDIAVFFHLIVILPAASFIFLALSLTHLSAMMTAAGILILWAALIPYPVWRYWQHRIA